MTNKERLLSLFSQDVEYNYHLVSTTEPNGNLLYLIKNGLELNTDSLEFSPLKIAEELVDLCSIKIEKFAPAIYFTDETDVEALKEKLNVKMVENKEFSNFIETIKDEYRILEVRDSMLYKKDPEAYNAAKKEEYIKHQKELWDEYSKQIESTTNERKTALMAYNNDLIKLLKEYFEGIIEYEKRDFDFISEIEKLIGNLINPEKWIKINDSPYKCRIEVVSLLKDRINVYLTDNNNYSFTATLIFKDDILDTENIVKIEIGDIIPTTITDYDVLILLYDIDITSVQNWDFKDNTDRFNYIIDYLANIFKENKENKKEELKQLVEDNKNNDDQKKLLENPVNIFNESENIDNSLIDNKKDSIIEKEILDSGEYDENK